MRYAGESRNSQTRSIGAGASTRKEEHNFPQAVNYYRRLASIYPDYYYAILALA